MPTPILEKKLNQIQCQIKVFNTELHLMQVDIIKISNMYKTISQAFLSEKNEEDDDDF